MQLEEREGFMKPQRLKSAPGANPGVGYWDIPSSEQWRTMHSFEHGNYVNVGAEIGSKGCCRGEWRLFGRLSQHHRKQVMVTLRTAFRKCVPDH